MANAMNTSFRILSGIQAHNYKRPSEGTLTISDRAKTYELSVNYSPHDRTKTDPRPTGLIPIFHNFCQEYKRFRLAEDPIALDGNNLSVAAVCAAARYPNALCQLDTNNLNIKDNVDRSFDVLQRKVESGTSIYGVTTGFGGSADTRTDEPVLLGNALLQMMHVGVVKSSASQGSFPAFANEPMPEEWVRGAILIRMNSLLRGHSGVRWELINSMGSLLRENITPIIPLRGSISASGDLIPLSYVTGALTGNPSIWVVEGPERDRRVVSSREALAKHDLKPISLEPKEALGLLNGTAFSASVASLALTDSIQLTVLSLICTAMGTEALAGTRASFDPFIHEVCRPHPGQIEAAKIVWNLLDGSQFAKTTEKEVSIDDDDGVLRQDRYSLRTSPQFIGPQIETLSAAATTLTVECNSTTDNPLIDGKTGQIHYGGNFQAMSVTNSMENVRLALHHIGKCLFSQATELMNPSTNRGLPPSLAATDPSLNFHAKGIDIALAAYVSELGYLANPVSTHIQSAEMHNQAINSLALISGRQTASAVEILTMLIASYLYILCQALDLRALQSEFSNALTLITAEELRSKFGSLLSKSALDRALRAMDPVMKQECDSTSNVDVSERMKKVAVSGSSIIFDFLSESSCSNDEEIDAKAVLQVVPQFREDLASRAEDCLKRLRTEYLTGMRGEAPAKEMLGKTIPMYEFVRLQLGVKMHGRENLENFSKSSEVISEEGSIGDNVSRINEAISNGSMHSIILQMIA